MKKWNEFVDKYMPGADKSDTSMVYGYGAASTLAKVLEMCGDDLTRANIMKQAASLKDFAPDTLLPGVKINTGPPTSPRSHSSRCSASRARSGNSSARSSAATSPPSDTLTL